MKNTITILLLTSLFASCKKEEQEKWGNITFHQSNYMVKNTYLWIDGKMIEVLNSTKYIDSTGNYSPNCGNDAFPYVATIRMNYGKHTYFVKAASEISDTFTIDVNEECKTIKIE